MFTKIKTLCSKHERKAAVCKMLACRLVLAVLAGAIAVTLNHSVKTVKIKDANTVVKVQTVHSDPYEILKLAGRPAGANDRVQVLGKNGDVIEVNRAFSVTVTVDHTAQDVQMYAGQTVQDALQQCNIVVESGDTVTPNTETALTEDMKITLTKAKKPPVTPPQAEKMAQPVQAPAAAQSAAINTTDVISTLTPDKNIALDASGRPLHYTKKISGKATAYCQGTTCATGVKVRPGYIAVNPKQIPYGTKMYIVSSDGKYNYGYAVAADTGGFAKKGTIVADLFMSSYDACIQFGRRNIDIYILED